MIVRVVIQRVRRASVDVDGVRIAEIGHGLLLLVGIAHADEDVGLARLAHKIVTLRIFSDEEGKMNRALVDTGGEVLAVSQFTLYGDTRKGRRPSFVGAAPPEAAAASSPGRDPVGGLPACRGDVCVWMNIVMATANATRARAERAQGRYAVQGLSPPPASGSPHSVQ